MKALFEALLFVALPGAASYGGWLLTEWVFRVRVIPIPFEPTGIAVGLGCFFWTLSLMVLFLVKRKPRGGEK